MTMFRHGNAPKTTDKIMSIKIIFKIFKNFSAYFLSVVLEIENYG